MLSVVTVIHGSAPHLRKLLASLDDHLCDRELIVVDTGPDDGGAELARAAGAQVVELPGNPGFGAANNAGVALATREHTALLNPDVVLLDDRLTTLVGPGLHVPRLRGEDSVHPLPGSTRNLVRAMLPGPLRRRLGEAAPAWATAAALVAPTTTLRELGPFDPAIFLFAEDLDLCLRAREQGVPLVFHRDVVLAHAGGHSTAEVPAERVTRHLAVVERRLGERAVRNERRALLLEHGLRAFRARDRAYVRAIRAAVLARVPASR